MVAVCPVCGYRFDPVSNKACVGCPVGTKCDMVCCPNCHYGWVESSSIVSKILKLFKKEKTFGRS